MVFCTAKGGAAEAQYEDLLIFHNVSFEIKICLLEYVLFSQCISSCGVIMNGLALWVKR